MFKYGDKSETIDIVLSNQVIEHITRYEKYLHELKRILKSNGILILSTPNFHNPKNILLKLFLKNQLWGGRIIKTYLLKNIVDM